MLKQTSHVPFVSTLVIPAAIVTTEASTRNKLIDAYKLNLKQKAEFRQKRQQLGTTRQMWANGSSFEEVEDYLIASMTDYQFGTMDSDDDNSSNEE